MKKDKDKTKRKNERPDVHTPRPPQVMDASRPPQKDEGVEDEKELKNQRENKSENKGEKKKLLGESPLEIDDETTI